MKASAGWGQAPVRVRFTIVENSGKEQSGPIRVLKARSFNPAQSFAPLRCRPLSGPDQWQRINAGDALRWAKGCAGFLIFSEKHAAKKRRIGRVCSFSAPWLDDSGA